MLNRKGSSNWGVVGGILAILIIGIVIYASSTSSPESTEEELAEPGDVLNLLLEASPGELAVVNVTDNYIRSIDYKEININGLPEVRSMPLADEANLEQGVFSGDTFKQVFVPNNNTVGAKLSFVVLEKTEGALTIELNGKEIAEQEYSEGEQVQIDLPVDKIIPEKENKIEISVSSPFWLAFWRSNNYRLEGLYLDQKQFYPEKATTTIAIPISEEEATGVSSAKLYADVDKIDKAESKKLIIDFNGEEVYNNVPGAVGGVIEEDLPVRMFKSGDNEFTFTTEQYGGYDINLLVHMTLLNLSENSYVVYELSQTADNVWPYIEAGKEGKKYDCELRIEKASGAKSITVWINENRNVWAFPQDGVISENICKYIQRDRNTITLIAERTGSSDSSFVDVTKVQLAIKKK